MKSSIVVIGSGHMDIGILPGRDAPRLRARLPVIGALAAACRRTSPSASTARATASTT
ncbi:hypothetical protein [Hydrogenophaga pseudoflava]|uniref:Uncharacterized protein n=1 Tax=Hydrogenophaga pseudoflava TaxID=47421 RepID=A0A4V1ABC5_HYDPS|nr:hypothetical protein [Hydrogenophaga pseudoflava]QBM27483.1 hypothetical protein HPF_07300 [Hydrogenophaga pseudoflava]